MQIDFVKTPYSTGPNMIRNTGPVFSTIPNESYLKAKEIELAKWGTDLWAQEEGYEDVIQSAAIYCGVDTNNIVELALTREEDVAVMYQGRLAAICFCFPSSFIPSERVGLSLSKIHEHVADGEKLVRASDKIAETMCQQPSFRRWVWTITNNPNLSNHPSTRPTIQPSSIKDLYFRVETQTTASVNQNTSLFFVKVDVIPLVDIWNKQNAEAIKNSIDSMSDAVLSYKNLHQIKELLKSFS